MAFLHNYVVWAKIVNHRVGGWLPLDHRVLEAWLSKKIAQVEQRGGHKKAYLHPVIQEFQDFIENTPDIHLGFQQMFFQVPNKPPYNKDPTGKPQVRDYKVMLSLFDLILSETPCFENNDLVGFPINAILDWPMGTPAGFSMFTNSRVNAQFKKMFDVWATFLSSPASCYVLTTKDDGWFGPSASKAMPDFVQTFVCNPEMPYYGFTSWDDFFTRRFNSGVRPVEFPNNNEIINSACESTVYCIAHNISATDSFLLKGKPYSLPSMMNNDSLVLQFIGGTIYQAFLSATKYHRWHSPVNGVVSKIVTVPGTYYAESPAMGFADPEGPDASAPNRSQSFITNIATRTMIFIEADGPIGLMCFLAVGMAEVSTCEATVVEGASVKKGDELGMFHFGGSTHCLIFRKETKITFAIRGSPPMY
ncbi:phosphatidylserine decarboxylase-like protein [Crucibulum laeve]|uniref:Phosphatidylserine decarboxylase-like protein n=1 Tax=Crucibulum laeve TaxID=68775 RepID=A0A5C3M480_9AGAR|nr:phosphatidylserine decarboxylase-like protein [Crucibulum laeve]